MKSSPSLMIAAGAVAGAFLLQTAAAVQITPGFTYAVASGSDQSVGSHFHSNTGGSFGNPAGKAEVGNFSSEEVRGLSEYDLTGLVSGPAFVTFNVFSAGGLFGGTNDFPFSGSIDVYSYQGNNSEDISDYQAAPASFVGSFSTAGLAVGDTLSLDIGSQYSAALGASWTSLGIRLQRSGGAPSGEGAWTFDSFQLTSTDESTDPDPDPDPEAVPDAGGTLSLLGLSLFGLFAAGSKLKRA